MNDCINSAKDLLAINDIKIEKVFIKTWQRYVFIKQLTAKQKDEYDNWLANADKKTRHLHLSARLVALVLVDESGKNLFNVENIHELSDKNATALDEVLQEARKLNDINQEQIEELAKN